MEIEAKFRIDQPAAFAIPSTLNTLDTYALHHEPHLELQHNTYYDTASGHLRAARYGLRTRAVDGRMLITLKGPGVARNGVHQRMEWEFEWADPNPATWPLADARAQLVPIVGAEQLIPILTIQTERRHTLALRDQQPVAELSLDVGNITVPGKTAPFCELEIEVLPAGTEADLDRLVAALRQHMTLVPENRSKLERGLELLDPDP